MSRAMNAHPSPGGDSSGQEEKSRVGAPASRTAVAALCLRGVKIPQPNVSSPGHVRAATCARAAGQGFLNLRRSHLGTA